MSHLPHSVSTRQPDPPRTSQGPGFLTTSRRPGMAPRSRSVARWSISLQRRITRVGLTGGVLFEALRRGVSRGGALRVQRRNVTVVSLATSRSSARA
jgi:hypothetical protein